MSDIVEFLKARIDEDEAGARAAADYGAEWHGSDGAIYPSDESRHPGALLAGTWGPLEDRYVEHIARHDPARVLAEVAAKRQMVELHVQSVLPNAVPAGDCISCMNEAWPCPTLLLLAAPYADHPDFNPSWRSGLYERTDTP